MNRPILAAGATVAGLAVALGAFGAHALKARLGPQALGWWQTAVQYQMWHALALVALGSADRKWALLPAWLLGGGTILFSLSLYALALGAPSKLGALTPAGGLLLIAGWAVLAVQAGRSGGKPP